MNNGKSTMSSKDPGMVNLPLLIYIDYYYWLPLVWITFNQFNKFVKWPNLPLKKNPIEWFSHGTQEDQKIKRLWTNYQSEQSNNPLLQKPCNSKSSFCSSLPLLSVNSGGTFQRIEFKLAAGLIVNTTPRCDKKFWNILEIGNAKVWIVNLIGAICLKMRM